MERFVQSFAYLFLSPVGMLRAVSHSKTPMLRSCCRCRSFVAGNVRVQRQSAAFIHTSVVCHVSNPRNTKKKIVKPVLFKPKSNKMLRDVVSIWPNMTVTDLADVVNKDVDSVFEALLFVENGVKYDSPISVIDDLTVTKQIVDKMGLRWMIQAKKTTNGTVEEKDKDVYKRPPPDPGDLIKRPPVVTIMGHVDHGKTTLLDALRQTNVVATEFGGITQHIGAFSVSLSSGEKITFLDTPGHAAFSAMRARGAMVTDIVVLVVAADDGVMKQTIESIRYAKEAGVAIIVAINKVDKPEADIERTKKMLLEHDIQLEDFGGDIQSVPISALKATNLDALQEAILALAEVLECRADTQGPVEATVIESKTDPGRGKLSTALIQRGTLKKGAYLVAGTAWAKVRGMFNDKGRPVTEAPPGTPVEVIGWRDLPSAGDEILQVDSEQMAKEVVNWRQQRQLEKKTVDDLEIIRKKAEIHDLDYQQKRQERLERGYRGGSIYRAIRNKESLESPTGPQLGIVVKGDVDGSLEAILDVLETYNSPQCQLDVLNYGVGVVCEYDVEMAAAFNGVVYGFNVTVADKVAALAKSKRVNIKLHNVIYRLIADIKERLTERLPPIDVEEVIGEANVQAQFVVTDGKRKLNVAGCRCVKGMLLRKGSFKLVRDGEVLITGELSTLKHFKNDVESIKMDVECGLSFADQSVVPQSGDVVVCFEYKKKKQEIKWDLEF